MIKEYKTKLESSPKSSKTKETKPNFRAQTAAKSSQGGYFFAQSSNHTFIYGWSNDGATGWK